MDDEGSGFRVISPSCCSFWCCWGSAGAAVMAPPSCPGKLQTPCSLAWAGSAFWRAAFPTQKRAGRGDWRCVQFVPSLQEGCRSRLFICINLFSIPPFPLCEPFPSLSWEWRRTSPWGRRCGLSTALEMSSASFLPVLLGARGCGRDGGAGAALHPAWHSHSCPTAVPRPGGRDLALPAFPHFPIWLQTGSDGAVTGLLPELSHPARRIFPPLSGLCALLPTQMANGS